MLAIKNKTLAKKVPVQILNVILYICNYLKNNYDDNCYKYKRRCEGKTHT